MANNKWDRALDVKNAISPSNAMGNAIDGTVLYFIFVVVWNAIALQHYFSSGTTM